MDYAVVVGIVVLGLFLVAQNWFWKLTSSLGALASLFALLASIIHFQILGALGYFILMSFCLGIFKAATD